VITPEPCPTGCGRTRYAGRAGRVVPGHLQRDVHRTWRAHVRSTVTDHDVKWSAYMAARDAAIASVPTTYNA